MSTASRDAARLTYRKIRLQSSEFEINEVNGVGTK
jgi:hypothetical protein